MTNLNKLFEQKDSIKNDCVQQTQQVDSEIQDTLSAAYTDWTALQVAIMHLTNCKEGAVSYGVDEYGEAMAWLRFDELAEVPEREREYLENYLSDDLFIQVDWDNETLKCGLGGDDYLINESGRESDRGVYQGHTQVIAESEYTDEDGDVDEALRNQLIEQHMEKTGCYPEVFRLSYDGCDLYPVSTLPNKG